jgi:hypothetical protein
MSQSAETLKEQLSRLHLIAIGDRDCDMSDNDLAALRAVLMTFDEQAETIKRLENHPGINPFADGSIGRGNSLSTCGRCGGFRGHGHVCEL